MFFLLRLCLGLMVLIPSLAYAQPTSSLDIPGHGTTLSGIGVISGWKCQANGAITVELLNDAGARIVINEGRTSNPVPVLYGSERPDIRANGACPENTHDNVGFVAIWNWGELGDGTYTAIASDNDGEFARNMFTVTTLGTNFLRGASKQVTVDNFPNPGDTTVLEWNQGTQNFEIVDFMGSEPLDLGECVEGLTVGPEEMCSFFFGDTTFGDIDGTFSINAESQLCVEVDIATIPCLDTDQEFESLLNGLGISGVEVTKNADGSWTIISMPTTL